MAMKNQSEHNSSRGRALIGVFLVAILFAATGCVTTTRSGSSFETSSRVKQSVAKRDLGIDYLSSRRTAMAIRELRASMKIDPSDPVTHLWLGEAYRRKGRTAEAEAFFLDAIELSDSEQSSITTQSARLNLSGLFLQLGRYEESLPHCEALAEDPTFSRPWQPLTNCGWALLQLGRFAEASAYFEEALDFFPRFGPALLNLGILRAKQGKTLAAIKILDRALESGRLSASGLSAAHFRLGEVYVGLGRRDRAVVHFRQATDKAPYGEWGSQSQAYLDLLH